MIEWIVTSSALILLVLLLRLLVRDRVSPRLRYALWGLVLLRLVIPVSLWESPASVLRAAQVNEGYQLVSTLPDNMSLYENGNWRSVAGPDGTFQMEPDAAGRWEVNQPRLHNAYGWVAVPSAEEARALRDQGQKAVDTAGLKRLVDVQNVLRMVWQTGIWLFMLFLAAVNGKFALDLRRGRRPDGEYHGRPVFIMDNLPTPCLFGLFRPAIYLTPEVAADETCRKHVLAHECAHFRQGDHAWAVWRGVCLALHWYNPLVWLAAYLSRRDCELSCDEGAVRLLGEENRVDYGRTLVGLVARRTTPRDLACCATTMTGGKSALKERIALLVKHPRTTAVTAVLVAAACAVFAACTFTGAAMAAEPEADPGEPVQAEQEPADEPAPEPVSVPEDLPTKLMDLSRPLEEQGEWLLLAETPGFDIALYRSAQDGQHVYLRVTNQSFQRFNWNLSGMELLPTLEVVDGDASITVRALYRRYDRTYYHRRTAEPGIGADQVSYDWDASTTSWTERTIASQPLQQLTEDLPALADLPEVFGADLDEPVWWIGEVRQENIRLYWARYEEQMYLRYGEHIQKIDEKLETNWLPEMYFEDLDNDGDRELVVIYNTGHGTGVYTNALTVYEWDGESWTWTTHDPLELIEDFNRQRDYAFYEDGTAYINYNGLDLLLDLSLLWESDYWGGAAPEICELSQYQINYTYEDGELWLTLAGELLHDGSPFLSGYAFECAWYVSYYSGSLTGYRGTLTAGRINELRSDFAVEPEPPELTDAWREVLAEIWGKCEKNGENVFAVHDVNGDGEDELIVRWTLEGSPNYGWGTTVYDANSKAIFYGNGRLTFYSNGAISVPWSHNQGPSIAIWPYDLYTCHVTFYNGINYSHYTEAGSARARSDSVPGFEDVAYADLDGDGVVYYVGDRAGLEEHPVDNDVYEAWRDQYLAGAQVLPVWYYPLTEENISLIG